MNQYPLGELERLLMNLIQVGTIESVDAANGTVTVDLGFEEPTDPIPWATPRAGRTRKFSPPSVGEQVIVLCPSGDVGQAIAALSLFQDDFPEPASSQDIEMTVFPDGSQVVYDSGANSLTVNVVGSGQVFVNCKTATINANEKATINSPETEVTNNLTVGGNITASGNVSAGKNVSAGNDIIDKSGSMAGMREIYNAHDHDYEGVAGTDETSEPNQKMQ